MSDLDLIAEYIHNAMEAVEKAHDASEELRNHKTTRAFDEFRMKMEELQDHLSQLLMVLDNEEAYAVDELVDALTKVYTGHRAEYRRTPRFTRHS